MEFNLLSKEYLKDIDTTAYLYEHKKTKARLIFFNNSDENKSFSISFKTIPYNDNGIFHILEHSVLCGSEKYPLKEPFVELIKGSFNTFINAMTFPDKTMYPVSSKNNNDLKILMDIYLDAVFNPNLLNNENILKQEGWHYHMESNADDLIYKGVVYSEMKGVYSSDEEIIDMHVSESLFTNTPYKYSYGGKPQAITNLKQKEFVETYNYCYHPSNSYIFLYGNLEIEEYLTSIDSYLQNYEYKDYSNYIIEKQDVFTSDIVKKSYFNDEPENKNYFSVSYIIGDNEELNLINSINIIDELLLGNSNTEFRKFFIDNNICEDVYSYLQRDKQEVVYTIIFKNVVDKELDRIPLLYENCLEEEISKGFDKEYIQAIINKYIFTLKEEVNKVSSPKGVNYAVRALRSWLYGGNPFTQFKYTEIIDALNANLFSNEFEKIANTFLLDNKKKSLVVIRANKEKIDTEEDLNLYKNSLTDSQIKEIIRDTTQLLEWQNSEENPEDLRRIQSVDAKTVKLTNPYNKTEFKKIDGVTYAHYNINTSNIIYSNLLFDISFFDENEIQYASLLSYLLFNINTKNKSEIDIQKDIDYNLGDIHSNISIFKNDNNKKTKIKFTIVAKNLVAKLENLVAILKENTLNSDFSNEKAIYNILLELKLSLESRIKESGHTFINRRLLSYNSLNNYLHELTSGYEFYLFVSKIVDNFETEYSNLSKNLEIIVTKIFNKNNLIISSTCNDSDNFEFFKHIKNYVAQLGDFSSHIEFSEIEFNKKENYSEAYYFDTMVNYIGVGFDNIENYSGHLLVLRNIINLDYLWNKVRVKGGAYGAGLSINKFGEVTFWSFRDPNIENTLNIYSNVARFINNLQLDDESLNKYIIGTLNTFDQLLSPKDKALISLNHFINETDPTKFDQLVEEIKSTKVEDLLLLAKQFDNKNKNICLITSRSYIENNSDKFSKVIEIK
ncbi:MAG: insulinase family protein [Gemella sp.]|nr:insulinase family protein [Gemella sp.]